MKADHETLIKAAELGILRSIPSFLPEPLKVGRLKNRFEQVGMMVDWQLRAIYRNDPNFFVDNKSECEAYLDKFGRIMGDNAKERGEIHVASVVGFCLHFLEESKSKYPARLYEYLQDILDYYERVDNMKYADFKTGTTFYEEWEKLKDA